MINLKKIASRVSELIPSSLSSAYYYYGYTEICSALYYDQVEILKEQSCKLEKILSIAGSLPFYKNFDVDPLDISTFPILDKSKLLHQYNDLKVSKSLLVVDTATSGSSGEPFKFARALSDIRKERLYVLRNFSRYGYQPGELIGALRSYIPDNPAAPKFMFTKLQNILWFSAYHMDHENLNTYIKLLNQHKVRFLFAYPSSAYALALFCKEQRVLSLND
ncbi:hypothetical protein [Endozoicomonas sp.]|uniref:hypothetical protein n=1 Tax=Endozoicomonas sp. TaxID=1892382 RepID=UPI003AF57052